MQRLSLRTPTDDNTPNDLRPRSDYQLTYRGMRDPHARGPHSLSEELDLLLFELSDTAEELSYVAEDLKELGGRFEQALKVLRP